MNISDKTILFVCTGNLCRSPMAAALFQHRYSNGEIATSAGLRGVDGQPAHPLAQGLMLEQGIDLSLHRARTVSPDMLMSADILLPMEKSHVQWIIERMPFMQNRVHLLGRWRNLEITDPVYGGREEFARVIDEIDQCLEDWVLRLSADSQDDFTKSTGPNQT